MDVEEMNNAYEGFIEETRAEIKRRGDILIPVLRKMYFQRLIKVLIEEIGEIE